MPLIYYNNGGAHLLPAFAELPVDVLSVDWRLPLSQVRRAMGPHGPKVLQGNLDPAALLAPIPEIERRTANLLQEGSGGPPRRQPGPRHPAYDTGRPREGVREAVKRGQSNG